MSETIEVKIRAFGILKDLILDSSFSLRKGAAVSDLLQRMMEKYGEPLQNTLVDKETKQIHPSICILRDGKIVADLNEEMKNGENVTLFIPVSGG